MSRDVVFSCSTCGRPVDRGKVCGACEALIILLIHWIKRHDPRVSMAPILGEAHRRLKRTEAAATVEGSV